MHKLFCNTSEASAAHGAAVDLEHCMDTQIQPKLARTHPLAGSAMSGADVIMQVLADEGVATIFGYSSGAMSWSRCH